MPVPITDAEFEAEQQRIRDMLEYWRSALYLDEWHVNLQFTRGPWQTDGAEQPIGECLAQWEYRRATITWDTEETRKFDDEGLRHLVFHEAMHILLNEMREDGLKHEERVCETLARVLDEFASFDGTAANDKA